MARRRAFGPKPFHRLLAADRHQPCFHHGALRGVLPRKHPSRINHSCSRLVLELVELMLGNRACCAEILPCRPLLRHSGLHLDLLLGIESAELDLVVASLAGEQCLENVDLVNIVGAVLVWPFGRWRSYRG